MTKTVKHARRYCSVENCTKIVKSQGVCQAHGAKTRKCKMVGCTKQAQGNFDGMCKKHFKESREELKVVPVPPPAVPPKPQGSSVYDFILPASLSYVPNTNDDPNNETTMLPLARHLKEGFDANRPRGWHRQDERRARGLLPVPNSTIQLEGWERELVWLEICILSGSVDASFRHLARAWGRDKGFHMVLAQFICERRGNVERKQRLKKQKKERRCKSEYNDGQFMEDILDFEDMELPIDMLHVLEHDTDDGEGGMVVDSSDDQPIANVAVKNEAAQDDFPSTEAQGEEAHHQESPAPQQEENDYCDPLDEHLLMTVADSMNDVNNQAAISAAATKNELVDDNRTHESTLVPT